MEMNIHMAINRKPRFLTTVYANLQGYAEFKTNFHHVSIRAQKDPVHKWYDLHYLAMDDAIDAVIDQWLAEWHATTKLVVGGRKSTM